jgi:hypothetical protein
LKWKGIGIKEIHKGNINKKILKINLFLSIGARRNIHDKNVTDKGNIL